MNLPKRMFECVAFALAVAYLSFIPLQYRPLDPDQAWQLFLNIPYLRLGVASRADWVTNILMYIPLGYLAARMFGGVRPGRWRLLAAACGLAVGIVWAFAVEFAQLYFPGRTVSQNDLIAESIGSTIGVALWAWLGGSIAGWWYAMLHGGRATVRALLAGYAVAYVAMSLFPFDFLASVDEIAAKLATPGRIGLWFAADACHRIGCLAWAGVELVVVMPIGWWWASRRGGGPNAALSALAAGIVLGGLIEFVQLFIASSTSQGASVLSRGLGMFAGGLAYGRRHQLTVQTLRRWRWPLIALGTLPYLAAVAFVNGWLTGRWIDADAGLAKLAQLRWLPFYYHYFSPEQAAMLSLLVHVALYVPVGVVAWLMQRAGARGTVSAYVAAIVAAAIAAIAGIGKLFLSGRHPDPTDLLLAAGSAWLTVRLLSWAESPARTAAVAHAPAPGSEPTARPADDRDTAAGARHGVSGVGRAGSIGMPLGRLLGAAALALALLSALAFPVLPLALLAVLAVYAAALWRWPQAYLLVLPAALPVLDLGVWSGRLAWDEFDLLVLSTIGIRLIVDRPVAESMERVGGAVRGLALALLASAGASALIGLWPLALPDANAFDNYLSPYNALRLLRAYVWVAALGFLIGRDQALGHRPLSLLGRGLAVGVGLTAITVGFERSLFAAPFDFGAIYRAAGLMSAMHVGDAYLDAFLALALPFVALQVVGRGTLRARAIWAAVLAGGVYAAMATFSRGGVVGVGVSLVAFALLAWLRPGHGRRRAHDTAQAAHASRSTWIGVVALAAALGLLALGAQSAFFKARLARAAADFGVRADHWQEALAAAPRDAARLLFGSGLGSFPRAYFWRNVEARRLASYGFGRDPDTSRQYLRLGGGHGLYVDQRIRRGDGPDGPYALSLTGRATPAGASLSVAVCEKTILSSAGCRGDGIRLTGDWATHQLEIDLSGIGDQRPVGRPLVLTLYAADGSATVAID
ncbi:MAG: VanZ family protein, partial [Burkholderiales bacterium]